MTTKIHALVDVCGLPKARHDGRVAADMFGSLGAGNILLADAACNSDALRRTLADRGARAISNHCRAFSSFLYRYRNSVERIFNNLKYFRAVATRYDNAPKTTSLHPTRLSTNLDAS